jgi:hypothetical protein
MNWKEFTMKYGGGLTKYQKRGEFNWKTYKDVGIQTLPSKSQIVAAQGQQRDNVYVNPVVKNAAQLQRINQIEEEERQRRIQETADRVRGTLRATTDADIEAQNREDYTLTGRARSLGRGDFNPLVVAASAADLINPASYWYAGKDFGRGVKQTGEGIVNLDPEQIGSGLLQTGLSALQLYPGASTARSVIKGAAPRLFGSTMSSQANDFLRSVRSMDDFATGSPSVYRTQPGLSSGPISSTPAISRVGSTSGQAFIPSAKQTGKYSPSIVSDLSSFFAPFNPKNLQTNSGLEWMKQWYSDPDIIRRTEGNFPKGFSKFSIIMDSDNIGSKALKHFKNKLNAYEPKNYIDLLKDRGLKKYLQASMGSKGLSAGYPSGIYVNRTAAFPFDKRGLESTRVHELTHLIEHNGAIFNDDNIKSLLKPFGYSSLSEVPENKTLSFIDREIRGINPEYYLEPSEIHARMNQGRFNFNLTPKDQFTTKMFDEISKKYDWYGMGRYIKDKDAFIDLMNNFWAIPATVGIGAGAYQQFNQKPQGTYQYGGPTIDLKLPQFEEDKPRPFFEMSGAGTGPQYDMFGYGYIPLGKNLGISADLMRWKEGDWRGGRYGISGNINIPINRGERRTRPDMKDPVMYQYGGASRADTLNLLANTRAVRNYYTGRDYTPDVNYTGRNLVSPSTSMYKNIWEALKADRSGFIATNAAYGIVTPSGQRKLSMSDYYRPIDRNKFYQREDQNLILDTRAPMQLYDKRIEPTGVLGYTNIKPSDPMSSDIIHFYTYDPISITPWDMLSTKQKKQRINKYGVSGTPYESKQDFIEKTSDQEVIRKQKLLKEAGLYKGEIDGDWGTGSEKAWKKYMELNTIPTTTNTSNTISETQVIPSTPRFNIQGIIADQYVPDAKDQTSREYRYRINTDKGFDVIKSKKDFEEWKQRNAAEYQPYYQRSTNAPIDYNKGRIQEYLETPTLMYTGDGTRRSGGESSYQYGGGFLPTRYTSNPYDPAIKNFNDSLNLYKGYVMQDYLMGPKNERISPGTRISWTPAELKKDRTKKWNPVLKQKIADDFQNQEEMFASDFVNENNKKLVRYYKSLGFTDDNIMYHTSADLVHPTIRAIGTYMDGSALSPIYKKPVQPVKYADPKVVEKQKILKDAGLYTGELDGVWGSGSKKAWEEYTKRNTTPRSLDGMTEVTYPTSTMIETTKLDPNGNPVTEIHYYDDLRTRERKDPKVQKYLVQTYNQMSTPYKKAAVAKYGDPSKVPFQGVNIYELNPNPYMKEEGGETNLFNWNNLDQWFKNGGESDFVNNIYSDYMDGVYDGTPLEENAKKVYDKLNTIYYRQAKESGMTPPNYIMTNVIKKALKPS